MNKLQNTLKKTPFFEFHKSLKARIINFGGWEMPVLYKGVMDEHRAVRNSVGLFDVSHMGEIEIKGSEALDLLQYLTTNDVSKLKDFDIQYTVMCYPNGGAVDDLLIYRRAKDHYLLCVNASNIDKDFNWIIENNKTSAEVSNISAETAQLAIQGPRSEAVLQKLTSVNLSTIRYYTFCYGEVCGTESIISRTGYTGEDGFEIYFPANGTGAIWDEILKAGEPEGIQPIGLGARDTLRMEMGYPLYGHELGPELGPVPARLQWIIKKEKDDFIGKDSVLRQTQEGNGERLMGFEIQGRGIPRAGYAIHKNGGKVGMVSSGTFSPSLNKGIGLGYVQAGLAEAGNELQMEIRSSSVPCKVVKLPFYKSKVKKRKN